MSTTANTSTTNVKLIEQKHKLAFAISSAIIAAIILFVPSPAGLSSNGWHTLLLVLYAIILWVTEAIAPPLTGLLVMVLFSILNILDFEHAIAGFGDTTIWLLTGVYIVSAAMRETGFDRRLALNMISLAKGRSSMVIFMLNVVTVVFVFLLPTSSGRASLITPICLGIAGAMNLKNNSNVAKTMLLSVSYTSLIGSMGLITGAVSMVYSVKLFENLIGFKWTYLAWMQTMLPGTLIGSLLMCPLLLKIFPPELSHLPGGTRYIHTELKSLGSLKPNELKVITVLVLTITCWIFESVVHFSIAQSCLIASIILMLPGVGVITWKKASANIEWGAIFLVGASIAMVEALQTTHAIEWVTYTLFSSLPGLNHFNISIVLLVFLIMIRLSFPNLLAMVATTLPVAFSLATSIGLNPVWLGLLCVASTVIGMFLPTQSITHLITYATGYYSTQDMFKAGTYATIVVTVIVLLMAHFYWPLLGITPYPS